MNAYHLLLLVVCEMFLSYKDASAFLMLCTNTTTNSVASIINPYIPTWEFSDLCVPNIDVNTFILLFRLFS